MPMGEFAKPSAADVEYFDQLLPDHPNVTRRPMFGNYAGFANDNMFLCLFGDRVAVRLDEAGRQELLNQLGAGPFEPMAGRAMKEYVELPAVWRKKTDLAEQWVERSLEFALALPPKKKK